MNCMAAETGKPLVSILVNNYNYGRFLSKAIDSAIKQEYQNIEVIVVDDGSADGSREIIESYGGRIIPVYKENGGQASAFNAGFAVSKGDIICLLDSDDIFYPQKIERIASMYTKNPDIGWLFHPLDFISSDGKKVNVRDPYGKSDSCKLSLREQMIKKGASSFIAPATSGLTFRRTLLGKILPMPEAKNVLLSDNYLKFMSFLLSDGFFLNEKLAQLVLHGSNLYTLRQDPKALRLRAGISIHTAYWIKNKCPEAENFTSKLMAEGIAYFDKFGDIEKDISSLTNRYLSSLTLWNRFLTLLRIIVRKQRASGNGHEAVKAFYRGILLTARCSLALKDGSSGGR
jgi:glycosyltransferase involved in cell wall biosynthesis